MAATTPKPVLTGVYTGADGTLTLADTTTSATENQDAKAVIELYKMRTVGRLYNVRICVTTDLREYHEIGRRHPVSLHGENISIDGSVDRAVVNGALLLLLLGRGAAATKGETEPYAHPSFNMHLRLNSPAVPEDTASLDLTGVKFSSWAYTLPEDDFVMEHVTFKALTIAVVDNKLKPKFPKK